MYFTPWTVKRTGCKTYGECRKFGNDDIWDLQDLFVAEGIYTMQFPSVLSLKSSERIKFLFWLEEKWCWMLGWTEEQLRTDIITLYLKQFYICVVFDNTMGTLNIIYHSLFSLLHSLHTTVHNHIISDHNILQPI